MCNIQLVFTSFALFSVAVYASMDLQYAVKTTALVAYANAQDRQSVVELTLDYLPDRSKNNVRAVNKYFSATVPIYSDFQEIDITYNSVTEKLENSKSIFFICALAANRAKIETVRLKLKSINETGFDIFCKMLCTNTTIENLDLHEYCSPGAKPNSSKYGEYVPLIQALTKNCFLKALSLGNNGLSLAEEHSTISELVQSNSSLTALDLRDNYFGIEIEEENSKILLNELGKHPALTYWGLSNNRLGSRSAEQILLALQKNTVLKVIELDNNNFEGTYDIENLINGLYQNRALSEFYLSDNRMNEVAVKFIVFPLIKYNFLTVLALSNVGLNDNDNNILPVAYTISQNNSLTLLDLSRNTIGDCGAKLLARGVIENTVLRYLDLYSNETIKDDGGLALATAMKINSILVSLNLFGSDFSHDATKKIRKRVNKNKQINLLTPRELESLLLGIGIDIGAEDFFEPLFYEFRSSKLFRGLLGGLIEKNARIILLKNDYIIRLDNAEESEDNGVTIIENKTVSDGMESDGMEIDSQVDSYTDMDYDDVGMDSSDY